jgi:hypothetical protein
MPIAETLIANGVITTEQLEQAMGERRSPAERIDQVLVRKGYVSERDVLKVLSEQLAIPLVDLSESDIAASCSAWCRAGWCTSTG